jgi:dihydrofolate reductase
MDITIIDFMTLDGVVQAPGGPEEDTEGGFAHGGWSSSAFDVDAMGAVIGGVMERSDALLFGRRTWSVMAGAWPERAGDPFADQMNAITKYVASTTLPADEVANTWNNSNLLDPADPIAAIRDLRAQEGGAVQVWGSATLARQLVEHDLVDEYVFMIYPLLVGGGKRIFPDDGRARPLELVSAEPTSTGVVIATYRPARP